MPSTSATSGSSQPESQARRNQDSRSLEKLKELAEDYHLEKEVEDWLEAHFSDLDLGAALIDRQVELSGSKKMDMLAVRRSGQLCVVEIKRDTPERQVFAQILDYARLISDCLTADLDAICRAKQNLSLADFFRLHFKRKLPQKWPTNPQLVIIAGDFDESLVQMASLLKAHRFDLKLLRYELNPAGESKRFAFHPVDISPYAFRVKAAMPACVVNLRYYESSKYQWNVCREEGWLPVAISAAGEIHKLLQDNPVHILIYLDRHGYVGSGTVDQNFKRADVPQGGAEIRVPVSWEYTLDFTRAIFRAQPSAPPPATSPEATSGEIIRLAPNDSSRWSMLMGQMKFRAAKASKNIK